MNTRNGSECDEWEGSRHAPACGGRRQRPRGRSRDIYHGQLAVISHGCGRGRRVAASPPGAGQWRHGSEPACLAHKSAEGHGKAHRVLSADKRAGLCNQGDKHRSCAGGAGRGGGCEHGRTRRDGGGTATAPQAAEWLPSSQLALPRSRISTTMTAHTPIAAFARYPATVSSWHAQGGLPSQPPCSTSSAAAAATHAALQLMLASRNEREADWPSLGSSSAAMASPSAAADATSCRRGSGGWGSGGQRGTDNPHGSRGRHTQAQQAVAAMADCVPTRRLQ